MQRPERHIVADGGRKKLDVGVLEDEADAAMEGVRVLLVIGHHFDRLTEDAHRAGGRCVESIEQLEQRRLPASVRAKEGNAFALADRKGDPFERDLAAVVRVTDVFELEDRRGQSFGHHSTNHVT